MLGFGLVGTARAQSAAWVALRTPGHFAMIRHALAPGTFDPPGFKVEDCSTQRNLSAEGRAQAVRIGEMFRANGIVAAKLYSSQWCRCLETARLMALGDVTPDARLNSFAQNRERAERQTAALRPWLAAFDLGQPTVLVTHQVVISAIAGTSTSSGEIVVLRRERDERPTVQGRIETS
ncbi:MAG: histidine phosphatase family protein [Reyranella sp.]|nr:MAG: histidine phosphatase family protein [Reyranella sp.]